jgi:tetratricopeptide (TPR) repeat protein/GTPase SAR1 family protein
MGRTRQIPRRSPSPDDDEDNSDDTDAISAGGPPKIIDVSLSSLGINISGLLDFIQRSGGRDALESVTTAHIVEMYLKPATANSQLSYCEHLQRHDSPFVGPATVYIMHVWNVSFLAVFDALQSHFADEDCDAAFLWLDAFSVNHHKKKEFSFESWTSALKSHLVGIGHSVMVLTPWNDPVLFKRTWCLYEIYCAVQGGCRLEVAMSAADHHAFIRDMIADPSYYFKMLGSIDSRKNYASVVADHEHIVRIIEAEIGFDTLNKVAIAKMRDWVLTAVEDSIRMDPASNSSSNRNSSSTSESMLASISSPNERWDKRLVKAALLDLMGHYREAIAELLDCERDYVKAEVAQDISKLKTGTVDESSKLPSFLLKTVKTYQQLGRCNKSLGNFKESLQYYESAVKILSNLPVGATADYSVQIQNDIIHHEMATVLDALGEYDRARDQFNIALEFRMRMHGEETISVSDSYDSLASTLAKQGDYNAAAEFYEKSLKIRLNLLGPNHPTVGLTYSSMAELAVYRNDDVAALEAFRLYDLALSTLLTTLGPKHPHVSFIWQSMAKLHDSKGDSATALELYQQALDTDRELFGQDHPRTNNLYSKVGQVYVKLGNFIEARKVYEIALSNLRLRLGDSHPPVAYALSNLASLCRKVGDFQSALDYDMAALSIAIGRFGSMHPKTAEVHLRIGDAYVGLGNHAAAVESYSQGANIFEYAFGPKHPETGMAYTATAKAYESQRHFDMALEFYEKALRSMGVGDTAATAIATPITAAATAASISASRPIYEAMLKICLSIGQIPKSLQLREKLLALSSAGVEGKEGGGAGGGGLRNTSAPDSSVIDTTVFFAASLEAVNKAGGAGEWMRSKIMILGEGKGGKTSFVRNLLGEEFQETERTRGIAEFTCSSSYVIKGAVDGQWAPCSKPDHMGERALARSLLAGGVRTGDGNLVDVMQSPRMFRHELEQTNTDSRITTRESVNSIAAAQSGNIPSAQQQVQTSGSSSGGAETPARITDKSSIGGVAVSTSDQPDDNKDKFELNADIVMKLLAEERTDSGLYISIFDYGGQEVFDVVHHLFLTQYGVYVLCFDMQWLCPREDTQRAEDKKKECLMYLKKWIQSVDLHTYDTGTNEAAPLLLVGTHADIISDRDDHKRISILLEETFKNFSIWQSIIKNDRISSITAVDDDRLSFFPVSNKLGREHCLETRKIMAEIERIIAVAKYTHKQVALTWLAAIDALKNSKQAFLSFGAAKFIACDQCKVETNHFEYFLQFLHEMGSLLWINEPGLRDVVIIDAIEYFVKPATLIICDPVLHRASNVSAAQRKHKAECELLYSTGYLRTELLAILWRDADEKRRKTLSSIMERFGLLVPLTTDDKGDVQEFIVPVLLKLCPDPALKSPRYLEWGSREKKVRSAFLFFSSYPLEERKSILSPKYMSDWGFLPSGLFERLLGRCIKHAISIAKDGLFQNIRDSILLYRDLAVMAFGGRIFRIIPQPEINCIRVEIEESLGGKPMQVSANIVRFAKEVVESCMRGLQVIECVPYVQNAHTVGGVPSPPLASTDFITVNSMRAAVHRGVPLYQEGREILSSKQMVENAYYNCWLGLVVKPSASLKLYDVFLSYRQVRPDGLGKYDDGLVKSLDDNLGYFFTVDRPIDVFLDTKCLRVGDNFRQGFAEGLFNSLVVVPICSHVALSTMLSPCGLCTTPELLQRCDHLPQHAKAHDPNVIDNTLLEWLLAIECLRSGCGKSRVRKVFPVLMGKMSSAVSNSCDNVTVVEDFFECNRKGSLLNSLYDGKPVATIHKCKEILTKLGITPSEKLDSYTIKSFVICEFTEQNGYAAWKASCKNHLHDILYKVLEQVRETATHACARGDDDDAGKALQASSLPSSNGQEFLKRGGESAGGAREDKMRGQGQELEQELEREREEDQRSPQCALDSTDIRRAAVTNYDLAALSTAEMDVKEWLQGVYQENLGKRVITQEAINKLNAWFDDGGIYHISDVRDSLAYSFITKEGVIEFFKSSGFGVANLKRLLKALGLG